MGGEEPRVSEGKAAVTEFIRHFATCTSPIMHLIPPPNFCISIVFLISRGRAVIPRGNKNKSYAKLGEVGVGGEGGEIRCIMVHVQVVNGN